MRADVRAIAFDVNGTLTEIVTDEGMDERSQCHQAGVGQVHERGDGRQCKEVHGYPFFEAIRGVIGHEGTPGPGARWAGGGPGLGYAAEAAKPGALGRG